MSGDKLYTLITDEKFEREDHCYLVVEGLWCNLLVRKGQVSGQTLHDRF